MASWLAPGLVLAALCVASPADAASARTHVVQSGQRLGSIAKRYNVSIEEICVANGIRRTDKIFPGQELNIPEKGKATPPPAASAKKAATSKAAPAQKAAPAPKATNPNQAASPPARKSSGSGHPMVHVVEKGQTLGAIARRYNVDIEAICHATGITRRAVLRIGQQLVVPALTDPEGNYARSLRVSGRLDNPGGPPSWQKYSKAPWKRGYITIQGYSLTWKGYVFGPGQKVLPQARQGISRVLGVRAGGPGIDDHLIRLMAQVSDQFGGRPLRIVSGYRETSFVHDSKHKVGRALDFSVPGVPNEAVRDYCRTLGGVGVGYYPNSSFVHLDVRPHPAYWVDYAGPGEPPRLTPHRHPNATAQLTRPATSAKSRPEKTSEPGPLAEEPVGAESPAAEPGAPEPAAAAGAPEPAAAEPAPARAAVDE